MLAESSSGCTGCCYRFELFDLGSVQNTTGAALKASVASVLQAIRQKTEPV